VTSPVFQDLDVSQEPRDYGHREAWVAFTRRLSLPLGADEIARELVDLALQVSGATSGAVYLMVDDGADAAYRLNARAGQTRFVRAMEHTAPLPAWLRRASAPVRVPARLVTSVTLTALPVALAVPIRWRTTLLGFMVLGSSDVAFEDAEVLATMADQAAASIKAVRLTEAAAQPGHSTGLDRLTTVAIHDIKNSVSALSMLASNATVHLSDPEFQREAITTVVRTVERMRRVLVTLSTPAADARPPRRESIDLGEIIVEATAPLSAAHGIRVVRRLDPVGMVQGDRDALLRVVENLTTNAVESIDQEGTVTVTLAELEGHAVITVADTGCGISEEFQARRLFAPYQSTKKAGWGVGLYQTRHAVESHGGQILVESKVGHGTTVTVRLPLHVHAGESYLEIAR
jgi:putative PEP-CTERM system histidine kinase